MRPVVLVMLCVVAAVVMLGAATSTWAMIRVPSTPVDGVQLPDDIMELSGAAEAPASVVAAVLGFMASLPLGWIGVADRVGPRSGTAARAAATLLAAGAAAATVVAVRQGLAISVQVVTIGDSATPTIATTPAPGIFVLAALVVLVTALAAWRVPRRDGARPAGPSRYTVEAVTGEAAHPPANDEDADEWDLAVADDPSAPGEER